MTPEKQTPALGTVTAHIYDTQTRKTHAVGGFADYTDEDGGFEDYWWRDGNASCESNRAAFCGIDIGPEHICDGGRFIVAKIVRDATGEIVYSEPIPAA